MSCVWCKAPLVDEVTGAPLWDAFTGVLPGNEEPLVQLVCYDGCARRPQREVRRG